jgi:transposase
MANYNEMYLKSKDKIVGLRSAIVRYAKDHSITETAEYFETTRKTVRKWYSRYDGDLDSLEDYSKRPHNIRNKLQAKDVKKIADSCELQRSHRKKIVGAYLIRDMDLPFSLPTVNKYIELLGFKQEKLSRKKRKRNLSEVKKEMRSFEKIQVDIKYLDDIPEFYREYYELKLPKYQITARCVKTGSLFIGYAREKTNLNTAIFIYHLLLHLESMGIDITQTTIQTDNGTEFRNFKSNKSTMFLDVLKYFESQYYHIPAGAKTWQSDVETSHRLIEDEFYAYKIFKSKKDFFKKVFEYQTNFNLKRKNSYKENETPAQILTEDIIHGRICLTDDDLMDVNHLYNLKPFIADEYTSFFLKTFKEKLKTKVG